jgi:peroxiredoxin
MKTIVFLSLICVIACHSGQSREAALSNLPKFDMLLMDSTTILKAQEIPTGQSIVLLFFRPDCPHCQQETRNLLAHADSLRNVRVYLLAVEPFEDIKSFYLKFHLDRYKNFTVAKDHDFSFFRAFRPGTVPYTVIYDRNKRLVKIYNQDAGIENILTAIRS